MVDEYWRAVDELDEAYGRYRKCVMERFRVTAAEVDVLLFLANNRKYDLAADIVRMKKMQKSQVSLAVGELVRKGYLIRMEDPDNKRKIHLKVTRAAQPLVSFGRKCQKAFFQKVFQGFTEEDHAYLQKMCQRMVENIRNDQETEEEK